MSRHGVSVLRSIPIWLGQTLTWVDGQVRQLPERWREMLERARHPVESHFDVTTTATQLAELYAEVAGR